MSEYRLQKYRLARNVKEGMQIQMADGEWLTVVDALHILAPLKVSSFTLSNGTRQGCASDTRVYTRIPAVAS